MTSRVSGAIARFAEPLSPGQGRRAAAPAGTLAEFARPIRAGGWPGRRGGPGPPRVTFDEIEAIRGSALDLRPSREII